MLATLVALLAAVTIAVPLSRRAGFGSVLGYLVAGIVIGPAGLGLVSDVEEIAGIASLGVVMLLFLIGLELRPQRLWVMRRAVAGLGSAQVVATSVVLAAIVHLAGVNWAGAVILGIGFAMSSTAIILPMLAERDLLTGQAGRHTFAVLLFQDMAFIPLVALVPLLASAAPSVPGHVPWREVGIGLAAIVAILVGGRFLMTPLFRAIGGARTPEVFTATALLIVVGTAFLAEEARLSASLGAFMAGVLLSDSPYRHELEADIAPFEGLLLGFFFISVGMSADLSLAADHPGLLVLGTVVLLAAKTSVGILLGWLGGQNLPNRLRFGLALAPASEFSFVLLGVAVAAGGLGADLAALATVVVAGTMLATPILFAISERVLIPRLNAAAEPVYDSIDSADTDVILCGFGRVGQIIGRVLRMHGIRFTALDWDSGQVDVVRRFGNKVYFGDPSRPDILRAAGAEQARLLIVALDDMEATLRTVDAAKRQFPHLKIIARARNRRHAHLLMDRGIDGLVRDTFHSALRMAELSLTALGIEREAAARAVTLFREHDEQNLVATHAIYRDETQLMQSLHQATQELAELFEADRQQ